MKLATYKDGSRDGQLVVVSRDLSVAHYATGRAHTLQQVLDDWNFISPQLHDLYVELNHGKGRHTFPFDPARCMAPLPRAHQWVMGHAGAAQPAGEAWLQQLASDDLAGPCDPLVCADETLGAEVEPGLALAVDEVPLGASAARALEAVRLLMLFHTPRLRVLQTGDGAAGMGPVQSLLPGVFGPVAITPDELGDAWVRGRLALTLQVDWNGLRVAQCEVPEAMALHAGQVMARAAAHRRLRAGALVGCGGWCVLQEGAVSGGMRWGDAVRIDLLGRDGSSVFGAIEQVWQEPAA
jgi:fumarylacetoacetate (FAA) hydrolase